MNWFPLIMAALGFAAGTFSDQLMDYAKAERPVVQPATQEILVEINDRVFICKQPGS